MSILFRSHIGRGKTSGQSDVRIRIRGTDWDTIGRYAPGDNVRDIVWGKYRSDSDLPIRIRTGESDFPVTAIFWEETMGDRFTTQSDIPSREEYRSRLEQSFRTSLRAHQTPGIYTNGLASIHRCLENETIGHLICIFTTLESVSIDDSLMRLAKHNDVIVFPVLHPFELNPEEGYLFLGKTLYSKEQKQYVETVQKTLREKWSLARSHNISYFPLLTSNDVENALNFFFKHRYARGFSHEIPLGRPTP